MWKRSRAARGAPRTGEVRRLARLLLPLALVAAAQGLAAQGSRGDPLVRFEAAEPHMGTVVRITLYAEDAAAANRAFERAFRRMRELDAKLSDYRDDSELNRLCRDGVDRAVTVSPDLARILAHAQQMARDTGGAFDVTVGPLTRLWREARRKGRLPEAAELETARANAGFQHLRIRGSRVRLLRPRMGLDLGGIAKGYAAAEALRAAGVPHVLVAAGGDLALGEAPPGQAGWEVSVAAGGAGALETASEPLYPLGRLRNVCVSTSGDTEQFAEVDGVRYSHILDPRTGAGLQDRATVTVASRRCWEADALATAIRALGARRGLALAQARGAAARIADGKGVTSTPGFPR